MLRVEDGTLSFMSGIFLVLSVFLESGFIGTCLRGYPRCIIRRQINLANEHSSLGELD